MILRLPTSPLGRLTSDQRGATIVEFALILVPFLVLIMGTMDLGYQVYLRALTTGALEKAARRATVGNLTPTQVTALIKKEVRTVLPNSSKDDANAVKVTPLSYFNFSAVDRGGRITGDTAPVGSYNAGDCYEDRNNNGRYDATDGGGSDLGTADDIVYYNIAVSVPRLFPIMSIVGWSPKTEVSARTLIRNQPFGEQQVRILCS